MESWLKIAEEYPIKNGLDIFRASFNTLCGERNIPHSSDVLNELSQQDFRTMAIQLLNSLQSLPAAGLITSPTSRGSLQRDLIRLISTVASDYFDSNRIRPLLKVALAQSSDDAIIWTHVYSTLTESTPPPQPIASSLQQTPWIQNTGSFANSSEYRKHVDDVLKQELGTMHVGLPDFHKAYFGNRVLETESEAVFKKCKEGSEPLYCDRWSGWPNDANQDSVLSWFAELIEKLAAFAEECASMPSTHQRRPLAQPNKPIDGSIAKRKLDVGFVNDPKATKDSRCHWSQILVPGELKSSPSADMPSDAWLDIGRYAREVLSAQATRRFVLGFTLCGSVMRVWAFDRLGGIASAQFDINKDGQRFVLTILGFLWMNDEQLGFDPTIITSGDRRFIMIERAGRTERIIIDKLMGRRPCVAGRATTCWKGYHGDDPQTPLVIKDSWQYMERGEEGEVLQEATAKSVINVARYYHHETVQVLGVDDDVRINVRKGLDIKTATNYQRPRSKTPLRRDAADPLRKDRSFSAGVKRSSSQTGAFLPPEKRSCSESTTKASSDVLANRVHRRVVLRDYGLPIYKASSRAALLACLEGCIQGHESLRKAGFLHRDISIYNLMINEDEKNPSWPAFLIDLDLAIKVKREGASGAKGKTGTRAFMAIGALLGEQHSFMHDLESFFWVLFWICIHYDGPDEGRVVRRFEKWNYVDTEDLAELKKGQVSHEGDFIRIAEENFTSYYRPLTPWVNRLRKEVFPNGRRWESEDGELYSRMMAILQEAQKDSNELTD